jgi:hypothetical protein
MGDPELFHGDHDQRQDRHCDEEPRDTEQLADDDDADRDHRRVYSHRLRHDERDDHVALDLLDEYVGDEHEKRLPGRVGEREQHRRDRAGDRAEVRDHHQQAERTAKKMANSRPMMVRAMKTSTPETTMSTPTPCSHPIQAARRRLRTCRT